MTNCKHENFACNVDVNRIEDVTTDGSLRFMADIRIMCDRCGARFRFIGLPAGLDYDSPCVSVDACEARMPIAPIGEVVSEIEGGVPRGFSVRKTT